MKSEEPKKQLPPTKRILMSAPVLVCLALVVACGDDDNDAADTAGPATTVAPAPTQASVTTTGGNTTANGQVIDVAATDFAFGGIPATVPAGTKFKLTNESDKELHEFVVVKVPKGEKRPVDELVKLPEAELDAIFGQGPPAMVLLAPPGSDEQIMAVGDGTVTEPGRYVAVCFIPEGADPQEYMEAAQKGDGPPDVEGGPPHVALGMYAEFTVEG